jgi:hypothetical protein
LTVALLAVLATPPVTLATAFAASAHDANIFRVPPPTGDPAADLAAVKAAIANAKAWQAGEPKGADGLAAKVEVVLAPGTYELCPTGTSTPAPPQGGGGQSCLQFTNWENLVFRGTGRETRIVLLDPDEGYINFFQSRHVRVADLTLDMKTVPFTQGRITAVHLNAAKLASLDVQLDQGFQTFADPIYQFDGGFLVIMDPVAARPKPGVPNFMLTTFTPPPYSGGTFARGVLLPDGKTWRLTYAGSPPWSFTDPQHPPIVLGDRFVFVTRRPNHGIFATLSDTVSITHVTIHAAGALTTGFVNSTGPLLVDDLDVRIPRGSQRLISSDADGAHFQNDRGPVTIRNSSFQGMADDAIAIYSLATTVKQVIAPGASGKVVDFSPRVILVGDRLQILDATDGAIRGTGTVTQAAAFKCPPGVVVMCYNLTLDAVPPGTTAEDIAYIYNAAGTGTSIHDNVFRPHRGNGILLFSPDSSVADNEFTEVPNQGITIGPYHAAFSQGPVPDHVVVRGNSFHGGDVGSIDLLVTSVIPKAGVPGNQTTAVDGPSQIVITDNHFRDPNYPAINVAVGDHIHLADDRIASDSSAATRAPAPAVRLSAGSEITVRDLSVRAASGVTAAVEIGCGVRDVIPSRWTIRSGQIPPILDLRPQCR